MIIKTLSKIKIHPLFYIFALIAILTGLFNEFLIFTIIIIVHEMGHIMAGLILKIKPKKIIILPFGGLTIFEMPINTRLYKELIIATMGPIFQILFWFIICKIYNNNIFNYYNLFILIFNLLPISPLDGSKILNILMNKITSFKNSYFITVYISIVTILLFIYIVVTYKYSLGLIVIIFFLVRKVIKDYFNFDFIFNKFLLERYKNDFHFSKRKVIKKVDRMQKEYYHVIKVRDKYLTEKEFLRKRFDFKEK